MHVLRHTSIVMTIVGLTIAIVGWVGDLEPVVVLVGVLLAWAGFVKIVAVAIWTRIALMGTDDHRPIAGQ